MSPHPSREGRRNGVVEVDLVEVEEPLNAHQGQGTAFLPLPQQTQQRAVLAANRIAATLTTGDGHDAHLHSALVTPPSESSEQTGLVVGMSTDEEDVETLGPGLGHPHSHRRCLAVRC